MNKVYSFAFTIAFALSAHAQDLAKRIPGDANVVVTVKSKNILELLSLSEFSNSKLGQEIAKEISRETDGEADSIEDIGVDLNRNAYYFLRSDSGVFYNTFMIPFSDTSKMAKLFASERDTIIKDGPFSYMQKEYSGDLLLWNNNTVIVVMPHFQDTNDYDLGYYGDDYNLPTTEEAELEIAKPAEEIVMEEAVEAASENIEETIETIEEGGEVAAEIVYEEIPSLNDAEIEDQSSNKEQKKSNYYRSQLIKPYEASNAGVLAYAKQLLTKMPITGILQNNSYKKSLGKGKDEVLVWVSDLAQIYKNALPDRLLGPTNPYEFLNLDELYANMTITGRLNFEADKAVMGLDYTMSEKLAKAYKPMYEGKFNKNFLGYINEDRLLGYMSVNLSTKGVLEAYPNLIEMMFNTKAGNGTNEKAATIAAASAFGTRLFSLLIDEEGAEKILRGDMLLLLTDIREKEVTYTDYEYDQDYNYKQVERTKTETVPDFMFLFTSEEEKLFRNLMKIGVTEKKVTYENNIYNIKGSRSTPFDIYMMYKDNTVFIGSSLQDLTQINRGTYRSKISPQLKKDISKNATSLYINGKNIVSKIPSESFPRELRKNIDFLTDNTEDLRMNFSKMKGNTLTGEVVLKTPTKGHKNSLAYFMNLIDKMME